MSQFEKTNANVKNHQTAHLPFDYVLQTLDEYLYKKHTFSPLCAVVSEDVGSLMMILDPI